MCIIKGKALVTLMYTVLLWSLRERERGESLVKANATRDIPKWFIQEGIKMTNKYFKTLESY